MIKIHGIKLENIYSYDELYDKGVRPGDIVALPSNRFKQGISWEYWLIRDGFPTELNTALCCYRDSRNPEIVYLDQIGFHWCGDYDHFDFRIPSNEEKKDFVDACINRLKEPISKQFPFGWGENEYSQILHSMKKWGLISEY